MFWNKKKQNTEEKPKIQAPEIVGFRLNGSVDIDPLKLKMLEPLLVIEGAASTHLIKSVGEISLGTNSKILRYYTDDEGYFQINLDGGFTENDITDVKLWYFYDTRSIDNKKEWESILSSVVSKPEVEFEGKIFQRIWGSTNGEGVKPVAMTEKTYDTNLNLSATDQFIMVYECELDNGEFEFLLISAEEKIIDGNYDRCLVRSTGFNINSSDIQTN